MDGGGERGGVGRGREGMNMERGRGGWSVS